MCVSVVIATRNSSRTIGRCLESLVPYQKRGDISEVIVVDGHSTDGTVEMVRSHPVRLLTEEGSERYHDSIIRAHRSKYHALDQGWRAATADLVMFLDSDAYLGESFFPQAQEFFADEGLGVLGCWAKAWVTTRLTETMGQLWTFHGERIRSIQNGSSKSFDRLYRLVSTAAVKRLFTTGPCYIVRRSSLELLQGHDLLGDLGISLRLQDMGWRSWWWVDAPLYHMPKESLRGLFRQRYSWGQVGTYRATGGVALEHLVFFPLRLGGAVALGLFLAARVRNPLHLVTLPLAEASVIAGYLGGLAARARGKR